LKEGKDLLIAYGQMVHPCLEAADKLERKGISLAVMNARCASPLDEEMILGFAEKGSAVITAEEGVVAGGFGSAVREFLDTMNIFNIKSDGIVGHIESLYKS